MAWIESHQGLSAHPKTRKLMRRIGLPGPHIVGHLHYLWWWALDFAQDGEITKYDAFDIADACQYTGDAEEFYDALIDSGFIDIKDDRYFLHDWYDYAGKLIELRKKDAERKRNSRGKNKESESFPEEIQRTSDGHPEESEGNLSESIRDLNLNPNLNLNHKELKEYRPETMELTNHLIFWMKRNNDNAKIPSSLNKWNDEMDKLERIDKYDYMKIRSAIDWCQQDSFWKSNILSVPKLREKMGTIVMQMQRKSSTGNGKVSSFARLQQLAREESEREASGNY